MNPDSTRDVVRAHNLRLRSAATELEDQASELAQALGVDEKLGPEWRPTALNLKGRLIAARYALVRAKAHVEMATAILEDVSEA